jgi:RHS repeat-associated protein
MTETWSENGHRALRPGLAEVGASTVSGGETTRVTRGSTADRASVGIAAPSLPTGGGAVRGIGEAFSTDPMTGTGSLSIPLGLPAGRNGFGPGLSLEYDTGAGNGVFGLGWNLSLPAISRRTERGLPRYDDSDVFVLGGGEDLVPGTATRVTVHGGDYAVHRYRPRVERDFTLIERWTAARGNADAGQMFWRTVSRDNVTTWYGRTAVSRVTSPTDPAQVFRWLPCERHDDRGNVVTFGYVAEDGRGVDARAPQERHRTVADRVGNRYLKHIRYGNIAPYQPSLAQDGNWTGPEDVPGQSWMFHVVLDYGDHRQDAPVPAPDQEWPARADPFSTRRPGFELRTYRLCRRVLTFHNFPGVAGVEADCLVSSTDFEYAGPTDPDDPTRPTHTTLASVSRRGYRRAPSPRVGYDERQQPPLSLTYSRPVVDRTVRQLDVAQLEHLPTGLQGAGYNWVDLDGEGLAGVLTEQAGGWFYTRNEGGGRFGTTRTVAPLPSAADLAGRRQQLLDLAGSGALHLVDFSGPTPGFHRRTPEGWDGLVPFRSLPVVDWTDPDLRFADLTGDGRPDAIAPGPDLLTWHQALGADGFGPARRTRQRPGQDGAADAVPLQVAGGNRAVLFADLTGDGLADLVRVDRTGACYWPNLGYGRFGRKVTPAHQPVLDGPDAFDPRRVRFADADGSGAADLIYLAADGARLYVNRSGDRWSDPLPLDVTVPAEGLDGVQVADLLGTGTACLVWSSALPGDAGRRVRYVDLFSGGKPNLLTRVANNLGGSVEIEYAPSTRFYLDDRRAGRPWATRLPFPVHCVRRVTTLDRWHGTAFTSTYSYHHGHYDGVEREFRGFARVEQVDVEDYETFAAGTTGSPFVTTDRRLFQPPVLTITWYRTGAVTEREALRAAVAADSFPARYDTGAFRERPVPEPELPAGLTAREWREAHRACRGTVLRQESYQLDIDALAATPSRRVPMRLFTVGNRSCRVERLQPASLDNPGVFLVVETEALGYQHDLTLPARGGVVVPDPRIAHTLHLRHDELGTPVQSVEVEYGRRTVGLPALIPAALPQAATIATVQAETHVTYLEARYTDDVQVMTAGGAVRHRRLRLPYETRTYLLTGLPTGPNGYLDRAELRRYALCEDGRYPPVVPTGSQPVPVTAVPFHRQPTGAGPQRRRVAFLRTLYLQDDDDVGQPVQPHPLGRHGPRGLVYDSYRLALTDDLLDAVFGAELLGLRPDPTGDPAGALLTAPAAGGYTAGTARFGPADAGTYWAAAGRAGLPPDAPAGFYLPDRHTDPFGNVTTVGYDDARLFVRSRIDPVGNTVSAEFDYRVLAPRAVTDASGNRSEVAFDLLGGVTASAVNGKPRGAGWEGDTVAGLAATDPDPATVAAFCAAATQDDGTARGWLGGATARYLRSFGEDVDGQGRPVWEARMPAAVTVARERHGAAAGGAPVAVRVSLECSDGTGAVLLRVTRGAPDPDTGADRWVVSGRTAVNNKGTVVKRYEPAFTDRFGARLPVAESPCIVTYHDAIGRLIRTETPDGAHGRAEYGPWHVTRYDPNDTARDSDWFAARNPPDPDQPLPVDPVTGVPTVSSAQRAAWLAAQHAGTAAHGLLDARGREAFSVAHNRFVDGAGATVEEFPVVRTEPDHNGDPLAVWDPLDRVARRSRYDLAGRPLFRAGMNDGERRHLPDATGRSLLCWDGNDVAGTEQRRLSLAGYDAARRPTGLLLRVWTRPAGSALPFTAAQAERVERIEYQDAVVTDAANLNGQPVRHYDPAGLAELVRRDLDGNITERRRTPVADPAATRTDWSSLTAANGAPKLDAVGYTRIDEFDALGRLVRLLSWHRAGAPVAVYEPVYDAGGALRAEDLVLHATRTATGVDPQSGIRTLVLREIRYDASGRQVYVSLGNGTATDFSYDPASGRLTQVFTTRPADPRPRARRRGGLADPLVVQDLTYEYDAAGNVTEAADQAYQPVFFANQRVDPVNRYEYDALYRLIGATGRENGAWGGPTGPVAAGPTPGSFPIAGTDPAALRGYRQNYRYDAAGNLTRLRHVAGAGSWTREFATVSDRPGGPGDGDRLWQTWESGDRATATTYRHDRHGNLLNVGPGPDTLRWDHRNLLVGADTAVGAVTYQHAADGTRVRARLLRADGSGWERLDLGGYQRYRRFSAAGAVVEEIESHHLAAGERRVLLVDDVLTASGPTDPRPDGLTVRAQTVLRYQYGDRLGSVRLELDGAAAILSYAEDHPYGTAAYRATGAVLEAPPRRYGFTGAEQDEETGLSRHGVRCYAPWLGRWISPDPAGLRDGTNGYLYVRANPVRDVDPTGRQSASAEQQSWWDPYVYLEGSGYGWYLVDLDDRQIAWDREAERLGEQWNQAEGHTTAVGKWFWSQYRQVYVRSVIGERPINVWTNVLWIYLKYFLARGPKPTFTMGGGAPSRLFHVTDAALEDIQASGRMLGKTEGSVYAAEAGATWTGAGARANKIVFEGEAAALFRPHPVFGPWSWMKQLGGQYKAGFGDLEILDSQIVDGVMRIRSARLVAPLQPPWIGYTRLWGSHLILEPLAATAPFSAGTLLWYFFGRLSGSTAPVKLESLPEPTSLPPGSTGYLERVAPNRFRLMEPTP